MALSFFRRLFGGEASSARPVVSQSGPDPDTCREALKAGHLDAAVNCFRAHLAQHPEDVNALNDLGAAFQRLRRYREALDCFEKVIQLMPADADGWYNAGIIHHMLGNIERAKECYRGAINVSPTDPEAHREYSMLRLSQGDFSVETWSSFRHRRHCTGFEPSTTRCNAPLWNGEPIDGKTVLVHGEQGLGDEILFASCYPDLIARAGHCVIETEPRLESLFRRSFESATVMGRNREAELATHYPSVAYHAPCGDLPMYFRSSRADFGARDRYLKADPVSVAQWRASLAALGAGLNIGISWRGGTPRSNQAIRSIGIEKLAPLFRLPGLRFVNLQYGDCREDIAYVRETHGVELHHWPEVIADYDQTAALVTALDLVITVTTSVAHLAGALGQKVWILLNAAPRWCYMATGSSMPWYPSARLFRQQRPGAWDEVVDRVAGELAAFRPD